MTGASIVSIGAPLRPLFASVVPRQGESFHSILIRSCEANVIDRAHKLIALAGIEAPNINHAPYTMIDQVDALSTLLSASSQDLRARMHPRVERGIRGDEIDWFGATLPRKYVESVRRSYAPLAAQDGQVHKAVWQIRPIKFDPTTFERLSHSCPHCGEAQGWTRTSELWSCEVCSQSLLTGRSEKIPQKFRHAASEACKIIDPDGEVRRQAVVRLPERFHQWDHGDVFAMIVELGEAKVRQDQRLIGPPSHKIGSGDFTDFDVEHLAAGYDFIRSWPQSFADYLASSPFKDAGVTRDLFGSLYRHLYTSSANFVGAEIRRERPLALARAGFVGKHRIKAGLSEEANVIGGLAAAKQFGTDWSTIRRIVPTSRHVLAGRHLEGDGSVIFNRSGLMSSLGALRQSRSSIGACSQIGVPSYCSEYLADDGLLERVLDEDAVIMGGGAPRYGLGPVLKLADQLEALRFPSRATNEVRGTQLSKALAGRVHPQYWSASLAAIRDGVIEVNALRASGKLLDRIVVSCRDLNQYLDAIKPRRCSDEYNLSTRDVELAIGVTWRELMGAIEKGYLQSTRSNGRKHDIRFTELMQFNDRYMLGGEMRSRLDGEAFRPTKAHRTSVQPLDRIVKACIWLREDADRLIAEISRQRSQG